MHKDLQEAYIPSCNECQRNKSPMTRPVGPLHPLPIPDACGDSVTVDFIVFVERLHLDLHKARDNLLASWIMQVSSANKSRSDEPRLAVDDLVLLSTKHRWRDYMRKGDGRVAKFMPRFDGPYRIVEARPETSTYTLDLPSMPNIFPTFHVSQL
ncbi:hypothetical protein AZE42_09403 [Rhizopogon vesiculosus]|uniref:Tf2-1-like SH3-like domain-containing protein n=1 Tax=Rhizopogon vesiculosus TaxID=180088 RepID=A0A1J8Q6L0_9AGAM|nr:hypothetical protein AZE42_09403 [Rhizopogon vesiculosus]